MRCGRFGLESSVSIGLSIDQFLALPSSSLLRRKLAKIDIMLGDVQNIVEGYVRFKTQPEEPKAPDSPSEAEQQEIQELEDRIAMFKEMIDAQPNQEPEENNK